MTSNQRQVIELAKFSYFLFVKAFEKQMITIEDQRKKQIKALECHGKQLVDKNDFNINKDGVSLQKQKKSI